MSKPIQAILIQHLAKELIQNFRTLGYDDEKILEILDRAAKEIDSRASVSCY